MGNDVFQPSNCRILSAGDQYAPRYWISTISLMLVCVWNLLGHAPQTTAEEAQPAANSRLTPSTSEQLPSWWTERSLPADPSEDPRVFDYPSNSYSTAATDSDSGPVADPTYVSEPAEPDFPYLRDSLWRLTHPGRVFSDIGHRLPQMSWLNRPWSFGAFGGMVSGSNLIPGEVYQSNGFGWGLRIGRDLGPCWGIETRVTFSEINIHDSVGAEAAWIDHLDALEVSASSSLRDRGDLLRKNTYFQWDWMLLYYPWGERQWRPYMGVGLGLASMDYKDIFWVETQENTAAIPLAVGLKYMQGEIMALRFEFCDNMVLGAGPSGSNCVHQLTLNLGLEFRFGGNRRSYWPYEPGIRRWSLL